MLIKKVRQKKKIKILLTILVLMDIEHDDEIRQSGHDENMITIVVKTLSSDTYRIKIKNDVSELLKLFLLSSID